MNEAERAFLERNHAAAMITLRPDGAPHAVRVGVALVDGRLWSSGTQRRARTKHLRRDPRAALFVFDPSGGAAWAWLALEAKVTILDGPDAPEKNVRLFQAMQAGMPRQPAPGHLFWERQERTVDDFLRIMEEEQRLIYEFEVLRTYGMH
jgi:PPOX class probable F420-dependent enzyme